VKGPTLIVDGYNIIGAWESLKQLKEEDFGSARDQLIAILAAYYPWCWERVIIVFDGQNFAWDYCDGVEVVFTEASESADTMIERLAAGLSARSRVEVATSDYAELRAAAALGATILSAPALKEKLEVERRAFSERLARTNKGRSLFLNDLLQQSVIDRLEKMRKP
jgi:predicted RNA-binding protein with PIN domain